MESRYNAFFGEGEGGKLGEEVTSTTGEEIKPK